MHSLILLILVIAISLVFDYINGFNDAATAIATCVSTRALSIRTAILMAAVLNLVGAFISTKVAATIGMNIVEVQEITQLTIFAGVSGAVVWGLTTWYFGIPSSSTHAVIGSLIGATVAHSQFSSLHWAGLSKIALSLILTPIAGTMIGFFFMVILLWTLRNKHPYVLNKGFRKLQIFSAAVMALSHGMADAQKSMGIITLALVSYGALSKFTVPWEVVTACATSMALGTAAGGWRIVKTIGKDFVKLQPVHGFCVQAASAGVILGASAFGMPTSTTHVITSTIFGVGLSKRISAIDWRIAFHILVAWFLTIPASGLVAFLIYMMLNAFMVRFAW
jgi:inorganic phosphate transporter, PiT family